MFWFPMEDVSGRPLDLMLTDGTENDAKSVKPPVKVDYVLASPAPVTLRNQVESKD